MIRAMAVSFDWKGIQEIVWVCFRTILVEISWKFGDPRVGALKPQEQMQLKWPLSQSTNSPQGD